jgi:hypothetical protein
MKTMKLEFYSVGHLAEIIRDLAIHQLALIEEADGSHGEEGATATAIMVLSDRLMDQIAAMTCKGEDK